MFHKGIQKAMRDAPRMSAQEVRRMSEHFNARLVEMYEEPNKRSWFKLFKFVDANDSGMICYTELQAMVRKQLELPPSNVPERSLMALWVALDKDSSGLISAGEFGAFMRLGEGVSQVPRELNFEKRLKMAADGRSEFDEYAARKKAERIKAAKQQARKYEEEAARLEAQLEALRGDEGRGDASVSHSVAPSVAATPRVTKQPLLPPVRGAEGRVESGTERMAPPGRARVGAGGRRMEGGARSRTTQPVVCAYTSAQPGRVRAGREAH